MASGVLELWVWLHKTKDILLNRIEEEYTRCDTDFVINGRF